MHHKEISNFTKVHVATHKICKIMRYASLCNIYKCVCVKFTCMCLLHFDWKFKMCDGLKMQISQCCDLGKIFQ